MILKTLFTLVQKTDVMLNLQHDFNSAVNQHSNIEIKLNICCRKNQGRHLSLAIAMNIFISDS